MACVVNVRFILGLFAMTLQVKRGEVDEGMAVLCQWLFLDVSWITVFLTAPGMFDPVIVYVTLTMLGVPPAMTWL